MNSIDELHQRGKWEMEFTHAHTARARLVHRKQGVQMYTSNSRCVLPTRIGGLREAGMPKLLTWHYSTKTGRERSRLSNEKASGGKYGRSVTVCENDDARNTRMWCVE